ncbi:MAG: hypothetical protein ACI8RD_004357 [Bacillariaceae sp.]|jgi:hypothetical protein
MVQKTVTAFSQALMDHKVSAVLSDLDHYRIHGGMAVETDYIVHVESSSSSPSSSSSSSSSSFDSFTLSKTYSSFRTFAKQLKKIEDGVMSTTTTDETTKKLAQYCETVHHLIESQRHQFLGKVSRFYFIFFVSLSFLNVDNYNN